MLFGNWDKTPNTSGDWWGLHPLHLQSKAAHLCRRCFNPAAPLQSQHRAQTQQPHTGRDLPVTDLAHCCTSRGDLVRRGLLGLVFLLNPVITLLTSGCAHSLKSWDSPLIAATQHSCFSLICTKLLFQHTTHTAR